MERTAALIVQKSLVERVVERIPAVPCWNWITGLLAARRVSWDFPARGIAGQSSLNLSLGTGIHFTSSLSLGRLLYDGAFLRPSAAIVKHKLLP